jgi:hypothetical protein
LKRQSDFRNYLAGAALTFGVVLLTSQILQLAYGGMSPEDREPLYELVMLVYLGAHILGGFLGGYLVVRVLRNDFLKIGIVTAVLAYIFEFVYNMVVYQAFFMDIYAMLCLFIGCVIGAMFFRYTSL